MERSAFWNAAELWGAGSFFGRGLRHGLWGEKAGGRSFWPLADLQIADVAAVDDEPHGRAHFVEAVFAGCTRIDVEGVVAAVVNDLQDVRVARDDQVRAVLPDGVEKRRGIASRIAADVGHQHRDLLAREAGRFGPREAGGVVVDVAVDGVQGFEGGDAVGQFDRADVARVPQFVHLGEEVAERRVEQAVRVGENAYAFHCRQR